MIGAMARHRVQVLRAAGKTLKQVAAETGVSQRSVQRIELEGPLETVADVRAGVTLAFLDGWKELYLPFLQRIEPALAHGALVIADDLDLFPDALRSYLAYVRDPDKGYVSVTLPVGDAMELSVRTG